MTPTQFKDFRTGLDYSQSELAEKFGVNRATINRIERSDETVPPLYALAMAHLISTTV